METHSPVNWLARGLAAGAIVLAAACSGDGYPAPGPSETPLYSNYLEQYLAEGACQEVVALWTEDDRTAANDYVQTNGHPTKKCPHPDVVVSVLCDKNLGTGGQWEGRKIIRYGYTGTTSC